MKNYKKPILLIADELSEGIYAASGSTSTTSTASYSLNETSAWDGNKIYNITLTNNQNSHVDSLTVTVKVNGTVKTIGGNVSGTVSGTTATITSNNYGNGFDANASATFYMSVTGDGDFSLQ